MPSASAPPGTGTLFPSLPEGLRGPLVTAFNEIERNYREARWEPSELNGGKLCEIAYTILRGYVDGTYPSAPSKPSNLVEACKRLEREPKAAFPQSVRITMPRVLVSLYEIRNNRGVGHTGGEVDPNEMDASYVLFAAKWIMAELVRLLHGVDLATATTEVANIIERTDPLVWKVGEIKRVLDPRMSMKERTLVLLYSSKEPMKEQDLFACVDHSNASSFRRDVLARAHKDRLLEYDPRSKVVHLSPLGVHFVEELLRSRSRS